MIWVAFGVGIVIGMCIGVIMMGFVASATFQECVGSTGDAAFNDSESSDWIMAEDGREEHAESTVEWAECSVVATD